MYSMVVWSPCSLSHMPVLGSFNRTSTNKFKVLFLFITGTSRSGQVQKRKKGIEGLHRFSTQLEAVLSLCTLRTAPLPAHALLPPLELGKWVSAPSQVAPRSSRFRASALEWPCPLRLSRECRWKKKKKVCSKPVTFPRADGKASGRGGCRCGEGEAAPSGAGGWAAPGRVPLGSAHVAVGAAHRGRLAGSVGCSARGCRRLPPRALRAATCLTGGAGKRSQHSGSGGRALRGAPPSFPGASPAADGRLGAQNEEWAPKRMSALEADGEARGGQASR